MDSRPQEGMEDGLDAWDAGLNKGLIFRPKDQKPTTGKKDADGREVPAYAGGARPAYYEESNPVIPYVKALAYAFIAVVPYLTILDQLGHNKEFLPCNDVTCHYTRIFDSKHIPATGVNVMGVRNGVERPVALHYYTFEAYSCPRAQRNRTFSEKVWGSEAESCPSVKDRDEYNAFLKEDRWTGYKVYDETNEAQHWTPLLKLSFWVTKFPLWLFSWPMNLVAKTNPKWGMENIPSAKCPGKSPTQMRTQCNAVLALNMNKDLDHDTIENHLRPYTPAKLGTVLFLLGYAILTAAHDVLLLAEQPEWLTLTLGSLATACYGFAGVAIFFWAMGAAEVFVSQAFDEFPIDTCACYFQIPEISALVGLATPFAVFAGFMARVQMQGLAILFGDYLTYQTYYVPHYLGRQSYLWTWAVLCSPKMAGTVQGKKREIDGKNPVSIDDEKQAQNWRWLKKQQMALYWLSMIMQIVVALVASIFMIAFKELCASLYLRGDMTPMVQSFIKYVLMPAPSVAVVGIGFLGAKDLYSMTIKLDEGETFCGQVRTIMPAFCCNHDCDRKKTEGGGPQPRSFIDWFVGTSAFVIGGILLFVWTFAACKGLSPDLSFMLGAEELEHPTLVQAELWGASGFIFFYVHIPRVMSIAFSTWDDLESLKYLAFPDKREQHGGKEAKVTSSDKAPLLGA